MSKSDSGKYEQTFVVQVNRKLFPWPEDLPKDKFIESLIRQIYKHNVLIEHNVRMLAKYIKNLEDIALEYHDEHGRFIPPASIAGGICET